MIIHFFKYKWNLFGNFHGIQLAKRLKHINGKLMLYMTWIYIAYLLINNIVMNTPNMNVLSMHWGYKCASLIIQGAFWILFLDGILVNFLKGYTKGDYYLPYIVRKYKYPDSDIEKSIKEEIRFANFLFTHPEFDYDLERLRVDSTCYANQTVTKTRKRDQYVFMKAASHNVEQNVGIHMTKYEQYQAHSGNSYSDYFNPGWKRLVDKYEVYKDEKGRYYSLLDKRKPFRRFIGVGMVYLLCALMIACHVGMVGLTVYGINSGMNYLLMQIKTLQVEEVILNNENIKDNKLNQSEYMEVNENQTLGQNVNLPIEELGREVQEYKGCTFEITISVAQIYISPTDYSHMYEATQGMQFVATGSEYVDEMGTYWYEFYIDDEQMNTAWIKGEEIIFLQ